MSCTVIEVKPDIVQVYAY